MPELNPNLILAGANNAYAPLNDLSSVYLNAQKYQGQQNELDAQAATQRQTQVMNDAYKAATGADGTVDPNKVRAGLAQGGAGVAIPGFNKANAELAHVNAQTSQANAVTDQTTHATLQKGLAMVDGSIAGLAADPQVTPQKVMAETARLANAGAFDVQAKHAGVDVDTYARNLVSTMPMSDPQALHGWLVQAGMRAADANERLKTMLPQFNSQDRGGVVNNGTVDLLTGVRSDGTDAAKTITPDAAASDATQRRGQDMTSRTAHDQIDATKEAASKDDVPDEQIGSVAKAIAEYRQAPMSPYAASKPGGMKVMAAVYAANPNYNEQDYHTSQAADKNFAQGTLGTKVRAFNAVTSHLTTLGGLVDNLNNRSAPAWNSLANAWQNQTGGTAPQNFEAAKQLVAKELVSAMVANGGGEHERQAIESTIAHASSPQQLKGVITTYQHLLVGQLNALGQQYESGTKRKDFSDRWLSPEARTIRQTMSGAPAGPAAVPGAPAPAPSPASTQSASGAMKAPQIDSFWH
jgi:hypothetical protein